MDSLTEVLATNLRAWITAAMSMGNTLIVNIFNDAEDEPVLRIDYHIGSNAAFLAAFGPDVADLVTAKLPVADIAHQLRNTMETLPPAIAANVQQVVTTQSALGEVTVEDEGEVATIRADSSGAVHVDYVNDEFRNAVFVSSGHYAARPQRTATMPYSIRTGGRRKKVQTRK